MIAWGGGVRGGDFPGPSSAASSYSPVLALCCLCYIHGGPTSCFCRWEEGGMEGGETKMLLLFRLVAVN